MISSRSRSSNLLFGFHARISRAFKCSTVLESGSETRSYCLSINRPSLDQSAQNLADRKRVPHRRKSLDQLSR